mmetsp:Transcript_15422/g.23449  ORF Transcript_15422/g.23449 Transcript_15422/m.23449 type:complete len:239 (+) Transcript_15422:1102-1818(+)
MKNLIWAACQSIPIPYGYSYSYGYSNGSSSDGKGPKTLCNCGLGEICEEIGWNHFEAVLREATTKLIEHGSLDGALAFIRELCCSSTTNSSEWSQVCSSLSKLAVEEGFKFSKKPTVDSLKNLLYLIESSCQSMSDSFVSAVQKMDIDALVIPFLTTAAIQGEHKACNELPFSKLAKNCAKIVAERVSRPLDSVRTWSIPENRNRFPSVVASFLRSPCKASYDEAIPKTQHALLFASL